MNWIVLLHQDVEAELGDMPEEHSRRMLGTCATAGRVRPKLGTPYGRHAERLKLFQHERNYAFLGWGKSGALHLPSIHTDKPSFWSAVIKQESISRVSIKI